MEIIKKNIGGQRRAGAGRRIELTTADAFKEQLLAAGSPRPARGRVRWWSLAPISITSAAPGCAPS